MADLLADIDTGSFLAYTPRVIVWRFEDAPPELQAIGECGGDEDWLALVPPEIDEWISWIETGYGFGSCDGPRVHDIGNGWRLFVGAHA